ADRPRFHRRRGDGWEAVTWRAFAEQIAAAARWLAEQGLRPGDRAAIYAGNSVDWAVAALAIQAAGGVMVPIYPASTVEQAGYVLAHSDAQLVFVAGDREVGGVPSVRLDGDDWQRITVPRAEVDLLADLAARVAAIDLDQPSIMLYTSGTSGPPKGVPLTHNMVGINARDWLECCAPALPDGGVDLFWLPLSHIFGFGELCLGNRLGFESWMCTPAEVLELLPQVRPNIFFSVPAYWEKLARAEDLRAASGGRLRFCLSGGAGLKREVKERFRAAGVLIIEGYGLTETSPTLTLNRPGDYRFDSVGKPLPSLELRLAEDGEILARGPNVFRGYHKDAAATAAAFTEDGWFKTGDVGRFTDDGFLQIVDRKKDILVTSGGKNVPPANIEARFQGDPVIEQVVVYGDARPYLVAGVWLTAAAPGDGAAAEAAVRARVDAVNAGLASFETIKKFRIMDRPLTVEDGLLTTSLKIRRKAIYAAFGAELEALYP
ncbi:MAG TPA: AMP-dependent synthetase/ligase, partial [Kofleriaceae bacterium]|nr:AMP-dependent synthetase/ligase [Kofleriaceae bacterium]